MKRMYILILTVLIMLVASLGIMRYYQFNKYNSCKKYCEKYKICDECDIDIKWTNLYKMYSLIGDTKGNAYQILEGFLEFDAGYIVNLFPFIIIVISLFSFSKEIKSKNFYNEITRQKYSNYIIKKIANIQFYSLITPIYMILLYLMCVVISKDYSFDITHLNFLHLINTTMITSLYINIGLSIIIFFKNPFFTGFTTNAIVILIMYFGVTLSKMLYNTFNIHIVKEAFNPFYQSLISTIENTNYICIIYSFILLIISYIVIYLIYKDKERFIKYAEL